MNGQRSQFTMTDATTPKTIMAPLVAALFAIDELVPFSLMTDRDVSVGDAADPNMSDRDITVKEMQPTMPDLCNKYY